MLFLAGKLWENYINNSVLFEYIFLLSSYPTKFNPSMPELIT
jgi:hypothetical protein